MGTIWHGYKLGNDSRNRHVGQEKEITATEFNAITPENCMKPMFVQPKQGVFTFAESDEMIDFAEANNLVVVGHTLVWKNQTPAWFFLDDGDEGLLFALPTDDFVRSIDFLSLDSMDKTLATSSNVSMDNW